MTDTKVRNLQAHTRVSGGHAIVVTTWQRGADTHYRFTLDGRVLDKGTLTIDTTDVRPKS